MRGGVVGFLVFLSMVVMGARQGEAIGCGEVAGVLVPCLSYLVRGGTPSPPCCNGISSLKEMTPTQQDRRTACQCVKDEAAASHMEVDPNAAASLPSRCGIKIDVAFSLSTDCQTIP